MQSRRCLSCGKWSESTGSNCPDCGHSYEMVRRNYSEAIERAEMSREETKEYLSSGNLFSRAVKRTAWLVHVIFGAISTAFVTWIAIFHY